MRQVLKFLGLITGFGPLVGAVSAKWDDFDAYGTVPAGEQAVVWLPAGRVSVAFHSGDKSSRGVYADLPTIADMSGRELAVESMGRMQGPSITKRGYFADERMRKRFASVEVPTGGDYLVSAAGCSVLLGCVGFERQARPAGVGQMARA
jgi:hypothetical protein